MRWHPACVLETDGFLRGCGEASYVWLGTIAVLSCCMYAILVKESAAVGYTDEDGETCFAFLS